MSKEENTVRLHRVFKAPPEKVYRAFIDPEAKLQWLPPYGFTAKIHNWNPEVGGTYRMSFTNFTTKQSHFWGGKFLELKPNARIKFSDKFEDPNLPDEMLVTITFKEVMCGTEVHITQEDLPAPIPVAACYLGWQESLKKLARLVEPEIKD